MYRIYMYIPQKSHSLSLTGWCFGTFFIFPYTGNNSSSQVTFMFFRWVGEKPPTSYILYWIAIVGVYSDTECSMSLTENGLRPEKKQPYYYLLFGKMMIDHIRPLDL